MDRREFHFAEGTSSKFWAVSVAGGTLTCQFGRIGSAGQTQHKPFATEAEANAAAEKLIAEKTRKGYQEVVAAGAPVKAPIVREVAPAAAPSPVVAPVERQLRLDPADWQRARGRPRPATPLPPAVPARPFDLDLLKRLGKQTFELGHRERPPAVVTPEEARFWLYLYGTITNLHGDSHRQATLRGLTAGQFQKPLSLAEVKEAAAKMLFWQENLMTIRLQAAWMPPADLVEVLACHQVVQDSAEEALQTAGWLTEEVYSRLDETAMGAVRDRLRSLLRSGGKAALAAAILAKNAGMADDLAACVAGLKKVGAGWAAVLFGLPDAERMIAECRRLKLSFGTPADLRMWLALTGHAALDVARASVLGMRKAAVQLALLDVLLLAESPEAAVALLEVKLDARPPEVGTRIAGWFKAHRDHAVAGLTPRASETTPFGEAARAFLAEAAPVNDAPVADVNWLRAALDTVKPAKALPEYTAADQLPPIHDLGGEDVHRVVTALAASTLAGPHPLVAALRRQGDRPALAAFAWALFDGWLKAGAPVKEKWALLALGHLGDDQAVMRLAPLVRAWPGQSQHQRAVSGLEVLRTIGTDTALQQLNGMALKLKFKALQTRARELMDAIAADRGLNREQLEDRIVPDLGLSADGTRVFDFGPRRFRFTLADDLAPQLTDEAGKPYKELPKPAAKDVPEMAAAAASEWKLLKAQLRETLKVQTARLEEAMVTGRVWPRDEFERLLVGHPFLSHLVRRLVWAGRDAAGEWSRTFHVSDAGAWQTHDARPVPAADVTAVRVAHRLQLTPGQVESWRQALDRLRLEPPFPQIRRPVYAPRPEEAAQQAFVRPDGPVPATRMRGRLEERGWRRVMHDQGGIVGFVKSYPAAGVSAVMFIEEWILIGMTDNEPQTVREAFFIRGVDGPYGPCSDEHYEHAARIVLRDVDPVAFSETARDLLSLLDRGK